jgi:hypothetical protein
MQNPVYMGMFISKKVLTRFEVFHPTNNTYVCKGKFHSGCVCTYLRNRPLRPVFKQQVCKLQFRNCKILAVSSKLTFHILKQLSLLGIIRYVCSFFNGA